MTTLGVLRSQHSLFILGNIIMLIYCAAYVLAGQHVFLNPIDGLDSNMVWYKVLLGQQAVFANNEALVEGMIGLQPRLVYPPQFDLILWLYMAFPAYLAFSINFTLIHFVAFLSMYALLKKVLPLIMANAPYFQLELFIVGGALLFGLIPFWTYGGLSSAGLPLIGLSFFAITEKKWIQALLYSGVFALYSSLFLVGVFLLVIYLSFVVYELLRKGTRQHVKGHMINIIWMSCIYVLVEYRMFLSIVVSDFVSHRSLVNMPSFSWDLSDLFSLPLLYSALYGQWHAGVLFGLIPIVALLLTSYFLWQKDTPSHLKRIIKWYLIILVLVLLVGHPWVEQLIASLPILGMMQWDRFYFLIPFSATFCFVLLFAYSSLRLKSLTYAYLSLALFCSLYYIGKDYHWNNLLRKQLGMYYAGSTYTEFYDTETYKSIRQSLEKDYYGRIVSLGLEPAKAVFNGIRSADGYLATYQAKSKKDMGKVIQGELQKNESIASYFYGWGNRCYFFNSEIGKNLLQPKDLILKAMDYDFEKMKSLGITHLISAYEISDQVISDRLLKLQQVKSKSGMLYVFRLI